ncbi:sensor histidine kinase [Cohnella sp. LGH]|uniref:cache domain-containing sensor histidine kinase n=1 Tax=Cohnella sp. LGH TaxID=1619153 RepID=UPI001ADAAADC|nr:sensor histidine kinase [Cohnella sp. LGH]QTH44535.1 sensor histidine kinase [Cohnella sp. LGH]
MRRKLSFYNKLLIFFVLVGVIPLLIIGSMTYGFSKRFFLEQYRQQLHDKVAGAAERFDALAEEYDGIMNTIGELPEVRQALLGGNAELKKNVEQRMHLLLAGKKNKAAIYLINSDGSARYSTRELPSIYNPVKYRGWGIFRTAHEAEGEIRAYPHAYESLQGDKVVLSLVQTVHSASGELLGYLIVDFPRSLIADSVSAYDAPFAMDFVVLDGHAYTVIHTKQPEREGTLERDPAEIGSGDLLQVVASKKLGLSVYGYSPGAIVEQSMGFIQTLFAVAAAVSFVICLWCAYKLSKYVSKPIFELAHSMKRISMGDLAVRIESRRVDEFGIVASGFNAMATQIKDLIASAKDEQRRLRIAEIKALQAQLNPHFIYNTLDLIKWNAKMNQTKEIGGIVVQLARLLRGMIHVDDEETTLGAEMELIEHYLYIQRIRFADRLSMEIRIDQEALDATIPRLLLHPLVENAIVHGFENKVGNVDLSIVCRRSGDELEVEIKDNGIGMSEETLAAIRGGTHQGGIGINNVHNRIRLYYGEAYGLDIDSESGIGTRVSLRIPYRRKEETA